MRMGFGNIASDASPNAGTGGSIGIVFKNALLYLWVCPAGGSITETSTGLSLPQYQVAKLGITSDGAGNVSLYRNGTLLLAVTGGPTTLVTSNEPIRFHAANNADAAKTEFSLSRIQTILMS